MIVANGILFTHFRNTNMLDKNYGAFTIETESLGDLNIVAIRQIIISKEAQKEYVAYGNQKSYYLPTGMIGPTVKLICYVEDHSYWKTVFSNDYLMVKEFGFPSWNQILDVNTYWWVDSISLDSKPGHVHNGKIRYEMTLDLYLRTV